jgi:hypothetical protein
MSFQSGLHWSTFNSWPKDLSRVRTVCRSNSTFQHNEATPDLSLKAIRISRGLGESDIIYGLFTREVTAVTFRVCH